MASVEKRVRNGRTSWRVRYRDPSNRQRSKTFARRVDADRFQRGVEHSKDIGTWIDPAAGRVRLDEWRARFVETELANRASTRARDESYWRNHIGPQLGDRPLQSIDFITVQEWVADRTLHLAPASVAKVHGILSKTLQGAVRAGLIPANRAEGVSLPKVEMDEQRFLTTEEIETLADAIEPAYRSLVLVGAWAGLRRGELFALRRGRVDLLHRRVTVAETSLEVRGRQSFGPPKSRAGRRTVPIMPRVADELMPLASKHPEQLLWTSPSGDPLRTNFRSRVWLPAVKRAGLEGLRMHDLRHTAVSLWIAADANVKEVATWAGHASVSTVLDRYGHLLPGREDRVMEKLNAMSCGAKAEVVQLEGVRPSAVAQP